MTDILKSKILYIDDSDEFFEFYGPHLREHFELVTLTDTRKVLESIEREKPQLILLDYYMPEENGPEVLARIRKMPGEQSQIPVLFISSCVDDGTVIHGLNLGAEDFISRTTSIPQIIARLKNKIIKGTRSLRVNEETYINISNSCLCHKGTIIALTQNEYRILFHIVENRFQIPKEILLTKVWPDTKVIDKTINTHLTNLRRKISECGLTIGIQRNGLVSLENI